MSWWDHGETSKLKLVSSGVKIFLGPRNYISRNFLFPIRGNNPVLLPHTSISIFLSISSLPPTFLFASPCPTPFLVFPHFCFLLLLISIGRDERQHSAAMKVRMQGRQANHSSCCLSSNKSPSHISCEKWNCLDEQVESTAGSMWELEQLMSDAQVSDLCFYFEDTSQHANTL